MNPKYCVSLETAKRMKELGFPQDTDFYRVEFGNISTLCGDLKCDCRNGKFHTQRFSKLLFFEELEDYSERGHIQNLIYFAAPHVGELIEMTLKCLSAPTTLTIREFEAGVWASLVAYEGWRKDDTGIKLQECSLYQLKHLPKTAAEALAQQLIYLAENGLIDPKALT